MEETEKKKEEEKEKKCLCQQYDLIWGAKVSCEFRKKVVEICKELWPNDYKEMANNLMAVFKWETGGTFKSDVPNQANSGGTGLIQFMPERAIEYFGKCTMEKVHNYFNSKNEKLHKLLRVKEFAQMDAITQLDYVKRYFEPIRGKKLEFVDFYLQVLFPVSSKIKEEHVVFADKASKLDLPSEDKKIKIKRVEKFAKNSGMDYDRDGKILKSEIARAVQIYKTEGLAYKTILKCENVKTEKNKSATQSTSKCDENCICKKKITIKDGFIAEEKIKKYQIPIIERQNWSNWQESVKIIILHRTQGSKIEGTFSHWKNGSPDQKGKKKYTAAHFVVDTNGDIYQTAALDKVTWHCANYNHKAVGIEVVGAYHPATKTWDEVTQKQAKSVSCLAKCLFEIYGLSKKDLRNHEDIGDKTAGEGKYVEEAIKDIL